MAANLLGHLERDFQEFKVRFKRDRGDEYDEEECSKRFKRTVSDALEAFFRREQASVDDVSNGMNRSSLSESFERIPIRSGSAPCNHPVCRNQTVCSLPRVDQAMSSANATPTSRPIATPISPSELIKMRASSLGDTATGRQSPASGSNNTIDPSALSNTLFNLNGLVMDETPNGDANWSSDLSFQKNHIQGAIPRRAYPANAPSGISQMLASGNNRGLPPGFSNLPFVRRSPPNSVGQNGNPALRPPFPQQAAAKTAISTNAAVPSFAGVGSNPAGAPSMPAVPPSMEWDLAGTFRASQEVGDNPMLGLDQRKSSMISQPRTGQTTPTSTTSSASKRDQPQSQQQPLPPQQSTNGSQNYLTRGLLITPATRTQQRRYRRVYCTVCQKHPEGFRGAHELERHNQREHGTCKVVYYTIDISDDKKFLSACKNCRQKKIYNTDYNAAAHLRRYHFNKKLKTDSKEEKERKSNSDLPPMEEIRKWMRRCRIDKTKLKDQKFLIDQDEAIVPDIEDEAIGDVDAIAVEEPSSFSSTTLDDDMENDDSEGEDHEDQDTTGIFSQDLEMEPTDNYTFGNNGAAFAMGGMNDTSDGYDFLLPPDTNAIFKEHMRQMGLSTAHLTAISNLSPNAEPLANGVGSFGTGDLDNFDFENSFESTAMAISEDAVNNWSLDFDLKNHWSFN